MKLKKLEALKKEIELRMLDSKQEINKIIRASRDCDDDINDTEFIDGQLYALKWVLEKIKEIENE